MVWLFSGACAAFGTILVWIGWEALAEAPGEPELRQRLTSSALTLLGFGGLLWLVSVSLAGIRMIGR
jgi:hypothetical protein